MSEESIFTNAVARTDPAQRRAYLDEACGADSALRREVEALLATHEADSGFLQRPAPEQLVAGSAKPLTERLTPCGGDANQPAPAAPPETLAEERPAADDELAFLAPPAASGHLGRLGHYEVQAVIGKGGFGVVLKAFDERLHRIVAIKVLSPAYAASGAARKRFIREARAAAAVTNEHVVGIYEVQEDAQPPYLVMECVDGISLEDKINKGGAVGVTEILRVGMQTAHGLAAAHQQGLVHRDIKPANILLENGVERVKITDFGLARAVDDASVTQSGTVAGTPMYMSPEQAEGLAVDHRSDLFSLGTVLYAMCTGHPPFRASGTHAVLKRVIDAAPRPMREVNSEIPDWLEAIVGKLHAKTPEDRFQSAKEVAELLGARLADVQAGRAAQGEPSRVSDRVAGPAREAREARKTSASRIGAFAYFVLLFAVFGAILYLLLIIWLNDHHLHLGRNMEHVFVAGGARTMFPVGGGLFAGLAAVVWGVSIPVRRFASRGWVRRLNRTAILCSVLAFGSGLGSLWVLLAPPSYAVTLEMDDPDILVRIWPTAQTKPPMNMAGAFEILGDPAHAIQNVSTTEVFLPAGHYWLKAELEGQEVYRALMHVNANSIEVQHVGGGFGSGGIPKVVEIAGAANLPKMEKRKLRGTWRVAAAEVDGKPLSKEMIEQSNLRLIFAGDKLTHLQHGAAPKDTDYTLDPRKKPTAIDIPELLPGGKTALAIYRWQGSDTLRICGSARERPGDFTAPAGSERVQFILQRATAETAKTPGPGWIQLFNGKDLTGWGTGGVGNWKVVDGAIACSGPQDGHLYAARDDYGDFHLRDRQVQRQRQRRHLVSRPETGGQVRHRL